MAIQLVKFIYATTANFPKEETYGLTSKMRRAAVSVPSNITEGTARGGTREFVQFLTMAPGSLSELETQVLIAR
ncbi:MAG: four helix bundle protein, partial [Burkholderiales bacterium]